MGEPGDFQECQLIPSSSSEQNVVEVREEIVVDSLSLQVKIGCTAEERAFPQHVVVNLEAELAPNQNSVKQLSDTVCYMQLSDMVVFLAEKNEWILVEDFGRQVIKSIFESFLPVVSVKLEIQKFVHPRTNWVGVRLSAAREEKRGG